MILQSLWLLLPIFVLVAGGYGLSRLYALDHDTLVKVIVDFLMPMLILHALYTSDIPGKTVLGFAGATTFVVGGLLLAALIYAWIARINVGAFVPSIIFMNSGFLGIPLMKLWGGLPAMNLIVIYDQIQTLYIFTLGLMIITGGIGRFGLMEIVKSPILWAIVVGFTFRFLGVPLPKGILDTLDFGGTAAPPLAALAVGVSLGATKFHFNRHLFAGLILRFAGGFLLGWAASRLFRLDQMGTTVVIVASSLPTAVFTSVLPLRYGRKADFAGTMVVITTLCGLVTIPLALWLIGMLS